jgi:hypothetical protein
MTTTNDSRFLSRDRTWMLAFLAISAVAAIAALFVGISDNPPGIFLAVTAAAAFVLAFVYRWRTPKQFGRVLLASGLGTLLFVTLHNVFDALADAAEDIAVLHDLLDGLAVATFLLGTLFCPAAILVSIAGLIIVLFRNRLRRAVAREDLPMPLNGKQG